MTIGEVIIKYRKEKNLTQKQLATAKKELIFRKQYDKMKDVEADIYDYI